MSHNCSKVGRNSKPAGRKPLLVSYLFGVAVVAVLSGVLFLATPVVAQDQQVQTLIDKIDRLQRELSTLQRAVYRGENPPAPSASAVPGDVTPTQAARIEVRLSQFEAELRSLTGQVEEITFSVDGLTQRIDRLVADVDLRLQRLESGTTGPALGAADQPGASYDAGSETAPAAAGTGSDQGPQTLGTISESELQSFQARQADRTSPDAGEGQVAAAMAGTYQLPGETPQEQYTYAFGLLRQANYQEAELALKSFLEKNPDDDLAGNAKYWLGETYYVRGDYQQAAVTFAEAYQEFPQNSKAPDNLLKLGMSLAALGSVPDACGTLAELSKRYPDSPAAVQQRGVQERQRLGCK